MRSNKSPTSQFIRFLQESPWSAFSEVVFLSLVTIFVLVFAAGCEKPQVNFSPEGSSQKVETCNQTDGTLSSEECPSKPNPEEQSMYQNIQENILNKRCVGCHQGDRAPHKIKLTNFAELTTGSRATIVAFKPEESDLLISVALGEMPPPRKGPPLSAEEIKLITEWICRGAPEKGMGQEPKSECLAAKVTEESTPEDLPSP